MGDHVAFEKALAAIGTAPAVMLPVAAAIALVAGLLCKLFPLAVSKK